METAVFSGRYIAAVGLVVGIYISYTLLYIHVWLQHNTLDIKTWPEVVLSNLPPKLVRAQLHVTVLPGKL